MLTALGFDRLAVQARYPGAERVPAPSALLSLWALKLLDKERRSHIDDFNCDTGRDQQQALLQGWVRALAPVMFPDASGFSLDFHPIPYRGEPSGLDRHYLPRRGVAGPSVLSFFALEQKSRCLCYSNADLTRADQNGEVMRFVEFWHAITAFFQSEAGRRSRRRRIAAPRRRMVTKWIFRWLTRDISG